jgi:Na+/melibiose symporter-like transporter
MKKEKDVNRLGFKAYFGTTTMGMVEGITAALMSSFFMLYLTDYSGIGNWAATLGSAVLVFARIFDAVNDPFEGWIIDKAKVGRFGKYKPFAFLSILLQSAGVIALFFMPSSSNPFFIVCWVLFGYLIYDIGYSFLVPNAIYKTLTHDDVQRGKLLIGPRILGLAVSMMMSSLIAIVSAVNQSIGDMHTSFGIVITCIVLFCAAISLIGAACIKERYHPKADERVSIKFTDVFGLIRNNKPLSINALSTLFSGFIYTLLFAVLNYYIKWMYCVDPATGVVDTAKFGSLGLIVGMMMISPIILGTIVAPAILKKLKSAYLFMQICTLTQAVCCGLIFILHIFGLLKASPYPLLVLTGVAVLTMGMGFVPGEVMHLEIMDYEVYKNGKDRSGLINAVIRFLMKAQGAIAAAAVGVLLTAVGYVVDSKTDTFMGELSNIPNMLTGFVFIMGLLPLLCGLTGWFILRKYPINDALRAEMKESMSKESVMGGGTQ